MANERDEEQGKISDAARARHSEEDERRAEIVRWERLKWIMDRFEAVGQRRRNVFSVDEAIEWWMKFKPRTVPTAPSKIDEEL